ncbi:hypothetical protein D3C71_2010140 [compost metagenome]
MRPTQFQKRQTVGDPRLDHYRKRAGRDRLRADLAIEHEPFVCRTRRRPIERRKVRLMIHVWRLDALIDDRVMEDFRPQRVVRFRVIRG